ncbi:ATP-binding protein [Crossiella cryophila]|uniref:Tetratricopeptide (TPR) repeat protein n=1 Tax=Crossiella cryophila TaxID=43355 RepID=A0A7W7FYY5_9PSEU|nr:AAA family ATPase [Crossiella cryophila]MBB4680574.1 tetratricopeptide (TPR) repeat protein [Crossiella cryophila]
MRTLLGRELPEAELAAALDLAAAGRGGLVLLTGEAGIGKTALAEQVSANASARGFRTRWGASGGPAFWPWIQVLRQHHGELGTGGEHPWLRPLPASARPDEYARYRLFDDLAGLLTADGVPTLVVLDDLHWADEGTVRCLEFLVPQLRSASVLVLGTCREAPEGELARLGARIELGGLDVGATGSLLGRVTGTEPEPALVAAVHERCGGNPFLATEVARLLRHTTAPVALTAVPSGVRQVTALRLAELSREAVELLCQAAVLGLSVDVAELAELAGIDPPEVWSRLAEPLRRGLIGTQPEQVLRFPHSLLREAVADRIPAPERAALHRRAATAIATRARADEASTRLADHLTLGDRPDEAAVHRVRAGRAALRALAYEDAAVSFQRALDLLGDDDRDRVRRARILLALAEARSYSGALTEAVADYERAFELARTVQDGETAARAALGCCVGNQLALHEPRLLRRLEQALAGLPPGDGELRARVLARLAKELDPADTSRERRSLVAGQALAMARRLCDPASLGSTGELGSTGGSGRPALQGEAGRQLSSGESGSSGGPGSPTRPGSPAGPRRSTSSGTPAPLGNPANPGSPANPGNPPALSSPTGLSAQATLAEVLSVYHQAMWSPHNARERLVIATEAAAAAEQAGADLVAMEAHLWCLLANLDLGERNAMESGLAITGTLAERLRHPLWLYYQRLCAATIRHADGDFAEAEALTRQALVHGRQANHPLAEASFQHHLARLALDRGDQSTAQAATDAYVTLVSAVPVLSPALRCVTLWLRAHLGHHVEARALLDRLLADGAKPLIETTVGMPVTLLLAEVAHLTGAAEHAPTLAETLRPYAGLVATSAGCPLGLISHALANLAVLTDRPEEAESHFQSTVDQARRMGARPWLARARADYATFLLAGGDSAGLEQARLAEVEASALGMPVVAAQAKALREAR